LPINRPGRHISSAIFPAPLFHPFYLRSGKAFGEPAETNSFGPANLRAGWAGTLRNPYPKGAYVFLRPVRSATYFLRYPHLPPTTKTSNVKTFPH
jgi:hypothetical protein